jgi:hypothetical protein
MATQKIVASARSATKSTEESFLQFVAMQWASFCFTMLDPVRNFVGILKWRYGCLRCTFKWNGLLCSRCIGRTRHDVKCLTEYFAKGAL